MNVHPMPSSTSSRAARRLGLASALCTLLAAPLASAQGIYAGDLPKEGYKLPGGFEPVLQLRTYYLDQESLTGSPGTAWALCASAFAAYLVAVFQLDPVVRWLWRIPVALFVVYPYLKRWTWLSHLWLGAVDGLAPMGGWVALTGELPWEAWALGGWAGLRSPWWGDLFQIGIVGYTSQKLYGPDDKDGTKLLATGQEPITVLGEAFKHGTEDSRESPSLPVIRALVEEGAVVTAYDPIARHEATQVLGDIVRFEDTVEDAIRGAKAIMLMTAWPEFGELPSMIARNADSPLLVDGRRMLPKSSVVDYTGIGLG